MNEILPPGYSFLPAGNLDGAPIAAFGLKESPVTNAEFVDLESTRSGDRFVLLGHDWEEGETNLIAKGKTAVDVVGGPVTTTLKNFKDGHVMIFGSQVLLMMVENPSAVFDQEEDKSSWWPIHSEPPKPIDRLKQPSALSKPVVGVSYFHAKAWCLLKSLESGGQFLYDLPTEPQFEYHSRAVVGAPEYQPKPSYSPEWSETVWRWVHFNRQRKLPGVFFEGPYGCYIGATKMNVLSRTASVLDHSDLPYGAYPHVGFSPTVVRQRTP